MAEELEDETTIETKVEAIKADTQTRGREPQRQAES